MNQLFKCQDTQQVYYTGGNTCKCGNDYCNVAMLLIKHPKDFYNVPYVRDGKIVKYVRKRVPVAGSVVCISCVRNLRPTKGDLSAIMKFFEVRRVTLCDSPPKRSFPFIVRRHELGGAASGETTFSAAIRKEEPHVKINDHTKLAGKESWGPDMIGGKEVPAQIGLDPDSVEDKDVEVDIDNFMLGCKDSVPAIGHNDKKLLK